MFSLVAPAAASVQLVGDFTHWLQKPIDMQKCADGIWQAPVELELGLHQYRFLVDGDWSDDPERVRRDSNPFGGESAVREVPATQSQHVLRGRALENQPHAAGANANQR